MPLTQFPTDTRPRRTTARALPPEETAARDSGALMAALQRVHPRYSDWIAVWRDLGWLYEGDGPYLDGTALVPHVREQLYGTHEDGSTNFDVITGYKRTYTRRRQLARYENFAATLLDLFVDYQYAKPITRRVEADGFGDPGGALLDWWRDVDGMGTHIDDWLKQQQVLTNLYGHIFVVMDRLPPVTRVFSLTPAGQKTRPTTLADLGRPVLRRYIPVDVWDWLTQRNQLMAIKAVEPVDRGSLIDPLPFADDTTDRTLQVRYYLWTPDRWESYDAQGSGHRQGQHGMGELPVHVWRAHHRARIPVLGRGLLRDGSLFRDHFNLISERRAILREQTFSMLAVGLGQDESVTGARMNLGEQHSLSSVAFYKGDIKFVAPPDGPAATYADELASVERKMFRMVGLPWDNDSRDAESAESRRIKAADLNARLASLADNTEKLDYWIARMFYQAVEGGPRGLTLFDAAGITIRHPDNFDVLDMVAKAEGMKSVIDIGVGPTATRLLRASLVECALPDLDDETRAIIERELEEEASRETRQREAGVLQAERMARGDVEPEGEGEGEGAPGAEGQPPDA